MNNTLFRLLVILMSLSLIGIILVQVYWIDTSLEQGKEQFKYHVKQVIGNVAERLKEQEMASYMSRYQYLKDSIGQEPKSSDLLEFFAVQKDVNTNETIVYLNTITSQDYNINLSFFDKNADSLPVRNFITKRKTAIYSSRLLDNNKINSQVSPDVMIDKSGTLPILEKSQYEIYFKDIAAFQPIDSRIDKEYLDKLLSDQFKNYGINTPFEYAVYRNGLATKVKSNKFKFNKETTYNIPVFEDNNGFNNYELLVSFPQKDKYLLSEIVGIGVLSLIFTIIIIIAYTSALNQSIKQRQISQIKTDFINNMTHEFKTPIATINLALDAIKNPKIFEDKDKANRYLQMIRDENKRMHAQVENVLRISKLEKRELEIEKEPFNVQEIIEVAIEHVRLIVEDREGVINEHFQANRTTVLLNEVHFTSVMVNILENAIKYSPEAPIIDVFTENVKDYILIKVKDKGQGMSKSSQKRVFEKFYREHTGDVHNVKGHGLGLAYVKTIVEDHNGHIYVESEKGKGSTFTIKIPLIN